MIDNLNANELARLVKRIERLEAAAPVGFTAVSRGALRIVSDEGLIVEGSARISGVMTGDGTLLWTGPITFTGPFTINGATTQNGEYTVDGDTTVNGDFDVVGTWDLQGNGKITGNVGMTGVLTIQTGGAVKVGTVTLGITSNGRPGLDFDGATLTENNDRLAMESGGVGGAVAGVAPTFAVVAFSENSVVASGDRVTVRGPLYAPDLRTISGVSSNMVQDPETGEIGVS
jgi:hypothetical protein